MRLIHPKKLKAIIGQWVEYQHRQTFKCPKDIPIAELYDLIECTPSIKVIPIEYIEKFKKEFRAVASVKAVIEWLLENWEKENE